MRQTQHFIKLAYKIMLVVNDIHYLNCLSTQRFDLNPPSHAMQMFQIHVISYIQRTALKLESNEEQKNTGVQIPSILQSWLSLSFSASWRKEKNPVFCTKTYHSWYFEHTSITGYSVSQNSIKNSKAQNLNSFSNLVKFNRNIVYIRNSFPCL